MVQGNRIVRRSRLTRLLLAVAVITTACLCCGGAAAVTAAKAAGAAATRLFTDSAGRKVQVPAVITRVAPSGTVATMILATLAPECMVSVSSPPAGAHYNYLPGALAGLPDTGQLYGSKATFNLESIIGAGAQIIIDLGDPKSGISSDLDALQRQTGITCVFIRADLEYMAAAYRTLGQLLAREEKAEAIASLIDETVSMAKKNDARIPESQRVSVMFGSGPTGLNANAKGSVHAQVIELVGAENAVVINDVSNKGGGNTINMEQLYVFNPDVVLLTSDGPFASLRADKTWAGLPAVKNGSYYEVPGMPYNWLASPPSVNMVLGVWWLGNLLYPDVYNYDMPSAAQRIFKLLWGYELTRSEAMGMLANSTGKMLAGKG